MMLKVASAHGFRQAARLPIVLAEGSAASRASGLTTCITFDILSSAYRVMHAISVPAPQLAKHEKRISGSISDAMRERSAMGEMIDSGEMPRRRSGVMSTAASLYHWPRPELLRRLCDATSSPLCQSISLA